MSQSVRTALRLTAWRLLFLLNLPLATHGQEQDLQQTALKGIPILPSATDSAIHKFDLSHYIYVNRDIVVSQKPGLPADRHELLLFLPGTQKTPTDTKGPSEFFELAANLGYHVIYLHYPNDVAAAEVCMWDRNPSAFEEFRMSIIEGGSSKHIVISRADSIENRLIELLRYLKQNQPMEHWEQFLADGSSIKWESVAVAGQSQGGGHAALIAVKHRVARVICTGAPKDYSRALKRPAAWYNSVSATPKACFFTFNHQQDAMGATPEEQMENLRALKLDELGAPADVDKEAPPYHHSRILRTNYPGGKLESRAAHTSVIVNKNADVFKNVWSYMLTEPVAR